MVGKTLAFCCFNLHFFSETRDLFIYLHFISSVNCLFILLPIFLLECFFLCHTYHLVVYNMPYILEEYKGVPLWTFAYLKYLFLSYMVDSFSGGLASKESTCNVGVQSLGWEDPSEKGTAIHSSIPVWRIPWTVRNGVTKSQTQLRNFCFPFHGWWLAWYRIPKSHGEDGNIHPDLGFSSCQVNVGSLTSLMVHTSAVLIFHQVLICQAN